MVLASHRFQIQDSGFVAHQIPMISKPCIRILGLLPQPLISKSKLNIRIRGACHFDEIHSTIPSLNVYFFRFLHSNNNWTENGQNLLIKDQKSREWDDYLFYDSLIYFLPYPFTDLISDSIFFISLCFQLKHSFYDSWIWNWTCFLFPFSTEKEFQFFSLMKRSFCIPRRYFFSFMCFHTPIRLEFGMKNNILILA